MTRIEGNTGSRNNPNRQLSKRTLGIRQKQAEAARLYEEGSTLEQIATTVGYASRASASRAVYAVLGRAESVQAEAIRAAHGERLARGYRVVFEILNRVTPQIVVPVGMDAEEGARWVERLADAIKDQDELRLKAVDRLGRLLERESKLHGLDSPVRTEVSGDGSITVLFDRALRPMVVDQDPRQIGRV